MAAMREDMFEVIIERPRWGSRMSHRRRTRRMDPKVDVRRDPDGMPLQIGIGRWQMLGRGYKNLNENLAPLRRYLERQVNRPWDKVWSEISENLSASSTVQQHVRDHVGDFVAMRTYMKDGNVFVSGRFGENKTLRDSPYRLYVDPRTGLLRRNKHYETWSRKYRAMRAAAEKHRATRMRDISDTVQAHRLDDNCWWEVRLAPIPTRVVKYPSRDGTREYTVRDKFTDVVHSAKLSMLPIDQLYGRDGVYAASKRQLSRREIAALDLPR
jgi:hypothetical protein